MHSGIALLCVICFVFLNQTTWADEKRLELDFKNHSVSARITDVPLEDVVKVIKEEKNIWVKGLGLLSEEQISVEFESLPVEVGLERILSTMNYSLIFDKEKKLLGIVFLGKAEMKKQRPGRRTVNPRRNSRSRRRR